MSKIEKMLYSDKIIFIAKHYGLKHQLRKLVEECKELIVEAEREELDKTHLEEEIADVEVMIEQIRNLAELNNFNIGKIKAYKIDRQIERIKEENEILIDSAKNLQNYCAYRDCLDCLFSNNGECLLSQYPCDYEIEEIEKCQ